MEVNLLRCPPSPIPPNQLRQSDEVIYRVSYNWYYQISLQPEEGAQIQSTDGCQQRVGECEEVGQAECHTGQYQREQTRHPAGKFGLYHSPEQYLLGYTRQNCQHCQLCG